MNKAYHTTHNVPIRPIVKAIKYSLLMGSMVCYTTLSASSSSPATTTQKSGKTLTASVTASTKSQSNQAKASPNSAPATTNTMAGTPPSNGSNTSGMSDEALKQFYQTTGVLPGTVIMPWPSNFNAVTTRYGSYRDRKNAFHGGLDLVGGSLILKAPDDGRVQYSGWFGHGGNTITVQRSNTDWYTFMHMEKSVTGKYPLNAPVKKGSEIGIEGATGGNSTGVHLHLGYGIADNGNKSRRRNFWLNSVPSKSILYSTKFIATGEGGKMTTDPTPYFNSDIRVTQKSINYYPYLGSTIRQQFNTLYGANLPVGPGATPISKPIPPLGVFNTNYEWTPDRLAAARASIVEGAVNADFSGYSDATGNPGGMSYQVLASFISSTDGLEFGTLPEPATPPDFEHMSVKQIIDTIAGQRYGNPEWEKAVMKLSSKGMLTEYTMMNATENFLRMKNQELKNRIEGLIAGYTSAKLFEFNKKIEALRVMANAEAVPGIIDLQLEDLGYVEGAPSSDGYTSTVDMSNLPNDVTLLMTALLEKVAGHESRGSYNAINRGGNKKASCWGGHTGKGPYKNNPIYDITNMTLSQFYSRLAMNGSNRCNEGAIWAGGKYQLTEVAVRDMKRFPVWNKYKDKKMTPEVQEAIGREYLLLSKRSALGNFILGKGGSLEAAKLAVAHEWSSVGDPRRCRSASYCPSANKDPGNMSYEHTQQVFAILEKIGQVNSQKK